MLGVVDKIRGQAGTERECEAMTKDLVAKTKAGAPGSTLCALYHAETPGTHVLTEWCRDQAAADARRAARQGRTLGCEVGDYMGSRPETLRLCEVE